VAAYCAVEQKVEKHDIFTEISHRASSTKHRNNKALTNFSSSPQAFNSSNKFGDIKNAAK